MRLQPCLAYLPLTIRGREGVARARGLARQALQRCAELQGLNTGQLNFPRDAERAPLPMLIGNQRWHWSSTNTKGLVAALLAPAPVGIDAEWLGRERLDALREYLPAAEVRAMAQPLERAHLALWSAKEAVIKLTGIGMAAMGRTRLQMVLSAECLALDLDGCIYQVHQSMLPEHVLSVACAASKTDQVLGVQLSYLQEQESLSP